MSFMEPLLALQELDARIRELQQEIRDIPARKEHELSRLKEGQERLSAAQAELRAAQTRVADFELQVQAIADRVTKLKQQQVSLKTNKEFRVMDMEIAACQQEADGLESQQLVAMEALVPVKGRVALFEGKLGSDRAVIDGYLAELDGRLAETTARLSEAESERDVLVAQVDANQLRIYDRLSGSRWPVIVPLTDGVCGGCHLGQPPSVTHLVRRNNVLVTCQMCGRLLHG